MKMKRAIALAAGVLALAMSLFLAGGAGLIEATTSERVMGAALGLVLATFGNLIPKNLRPLSDSRCDPAKAQAYRRFAGWTFVLAGLGSAAVWLTFPMALANYASMVIIAASVVVVVGVCVVARRSAESPA